MLHWLKASSAQPRSSKAARTRRSSSRMARGSRVSRHGAGSTSGTANWKSTLARCTHLGPLLAVLAGVVCSAVDVCIRQPPRQPVARGTQSRIDAARRGEWGNSAGVVTSASAKRPHTSCASNAAPMLAHQPSPHSKQLHSGRSAVTVAATPKLIETHYSCQLH